MATDKSHYNRKVKVSQRTIDDIKKLGMKKSLELAASNKDAEQGGVVAEFAEGVRRMYGERRYMNAVYNPKSSPGIEKPNDQKRNPKTRNTGRGN